MTVYEALEDAGPHGRRREHHLLPRPHARTCRSFPGSPRPAYGPKRFFFYSLFESDVTGAPLAVFGRSTGSSTPTRATSAAGSSRATASTSSSTTCPTTTSPRTRSGRAGDAGGARAQRRGGRRPVEAAGGPDEFLERYAVVVCSDHGQTHVDRAVSLRGVASPGVEGVRRDRLEPGRDGLPAARVPRGRGRAGAAARRRRPRPRSCSSARATRPSRGGTARSFASRPPTKAGERAATSPLLDQPDALERAWAALANPNAGELLVSPPRRRRVRRPRGPQPPRRRQPRLARGRRLEVPMLTVGLEADAARGSSTSRRSRSRTSASSRRPTRVPPCSLRGAAAHGRAPAARRATSTTSACSRRWSACRASSSCRSSSAGAPTTTRRCRSATARRSRSRTWSRGSCEALSPCGRRARARRRHRLGLPGRGARRARRGRGHDRADSRARGAGAREPRRGGLRRRRGRRRRRHARHPERAPFDAIAVAAAAPELPETLYEQLEPARAARGARSAAARRSGSS